MNQDEMKQWLDDWHDYCGEHCIKNDCVGGIENCKQAYNQIVALIKKPQVTDEWIHKKQKAWTDGYWQLPDHLLVTLFEYTQNFIRSVIEEIQRKDVCSICGDEHEHPLGYKTSTCGKFECLGAMAQDSKSEFEEPK